ncbi:Inner membrane protein YhaI [Frondihabitans sp. 762G35]|uniref:DUF805 domain-containing protein n=1 Tax=Frondihabitans sp. 762G35 TaxID=1446794 RepID=UPI000D20B262|nr:DUF805 domain-containing protein [Frondihabitans sp. 762G35]ARC56966.1 Inner membrane protein YhaI [Frondihabitans sp. 762G35]
MSSLEQPVTVPMSQPLPGASFSQAVSRFWKKYATFSGRASRSEYWWWYLVAFLVNAFLNSLGRVDGPAGQVFQAVAGVWSLAIIIPTLALLWRRLHDTNRSGLWAFAPLVLAVIGVVLAVVGLVVLHVSTGQSASLAAGGVALVLAGAAFLASFVIVLILTLLPSNPAGARFDRGR